MARYIDADAFKRDLIHLGFYPALVSNTLDKQPTADVAPRADVAREIFEEIELLLDTYSASHHSIGEVCGESYFERGLENAIAELKKKYESEGADDEQNL